MIIRKTKTHVLLARYGGVVNGKNLEVRIGSVPIGTSPNTVPADIMEDLTPKELKQLQAELAADQKQILVDKVSHLIADLNDLTSALESGLLDLDTVADLHKAATLFGKRSRRVMSKVVTETSVAESS